MKIYRYEAGDILILKKAHPCGSTGWKVLRTGTDLKLKCTGCGREIMAARPAVEKKIRSIEKMD